MTLALDVLAVGLLVTLGARACLDFDTSWDSMSYHLPFGARLVGLVGADQFQFSDRFEATYAGFPVLAEAVQATLWRLTGRAESTNLVGFGALVAFVTVLRARYGVPLWAGVTGLLAIPMVLMHATISYVDLPGNALLACGLLLLRDVLERRTTRPGRDALAALALFALAANVKVQMIPLAAAAAAATLIAAWRPLRDTPSRTARTLGPRAVPAFAVVLALTVGVVPLENLVRFGNPFYPVTVQLAGHDFRGFVEEGVPAYVVERPDPEWLADSPQPVRWLLSLAEIRAFEERGDTPYIYDQGDVRPDAPSYRMGGYFAPYVLGSVATFVWLVVRERDRARRRARGLLGLAVTLATSVMPASQELRYYMFWMMLVVAVCLVEIHGRPAKGQTGQGESPRWWGRVLVPAHGLATLLFFAAVQMRTHGAFVAPRGISPRQALESVGLEERLAQLYRPGARLCLVQRNPWTFLYARYFHPQLAPYTVRQADHLGECAQTDVIW